MLDLPMETQHAVYCPKQRLLRCCLARRLPPSAFAASPDTTGCPAGMHRADSEGGPGFATRRLTRKPQWRRNPQGGPGWQQQASAARKADSEGGPAGSSSFAARKADSEGGPGWQQQAGTRKADSEGGQLSTALRQQRPASSSGRRRTLPARPRAATASRDPSFMSAAARPSIATPTGCCSCPEGAPPGMGAVAGAPSARRVAPPRVSPRERPERR